MNIKGKFERDLGVTEVTSKSTGKRWSKRTILVRTTDEYDNLYPIEFFGEKAQENLKGVNVGDTIDVEFNVKTNEHQGKFYISLGGWKVSKEQAAQPTAAQQAHIPNVPQPVMDDDQSGLPF